MPGAAVPAPDAPDAPDTSVIEALPTAPPAVARQRWRLVLARASGVPDGSGRDQGEAWESAIEASGLPLFRPAGRARPRIAFGAPLPAGIAAERELADIVLMSFEPVWRVREALADRLPVGWRLVDLHDVWLGVPALAGQVVAADYRIDLGAVDAQAMTAAAKGLLDAERLPRERLKGTSIVRYDLRPLLLDVRVVAAGPPLFVCARTRFHPELGTGRPAEVVAALGDVAGAALVIGSVVRERLILADELDLSPDESHPQPEELDPGARALGR